MGMPTTDYIEDRGKVVFDHATTFPRSYNYHKLFCVQLLIVLTINLWTSDIYC